MDLKGLPFFTGVAIYCYEGAGMILSLEASIAKDYRSRFKVTLLLNVATKHKNRSVYLFNGNYGNDSALYFVWSLWISLVWSWHSRNYYFEFTRWSNAFDCERVSLLFFIFHISSYAFPCWLVERDATARMRWPNTDQELKIISVEIIERRIGIQGSVMKGNILRAGLVLITIVTVCIITDFSTIMVLIGATCCSLLGKCFIISPRFPSQPTRDPRTACFTDRSVWDFSVLVLARGGTF